MKKIVIISIAVLLIATVIIMAISVPNQIQQADSENEKLLPFIPSSSGDLNEDNQEDLPAPPKPEEEEKIILNIEYCEPLTNQTEKDNCWTDLANQIWTKEKDEAKAAEICKKIIDVQSHDSCLDDVSYDLLETCEAMKTKDSDPKDWYNDCIDFVAYYVEDCLRIKKDDKLMSECIEFAAETSEDCDLIPLENIKERCKRNLAKE